MEPNPFDKYTSQNPIVRLLVKNFTNTLIKTTLFCAQKLYKEKKGPIKILEIGCGNGIISKKVCDAIKNNCPNINFTYHATDINPAYIDSAKKLFESSQHNIVFSVASIYDDDFFDQQRADIVLCFEVLEHLKFPENGLKNICNATKDFAIISVPDEPLWSILNMLRFKYWKSFGNTPGHLQRWNTKSFSVLAKNAGFEIININKTTPWMILTLKNKAT